MSVDEILEKIQDDSIEMEGSPRKDWEDKRTEAKQSLLEAVLAKMPKKKPNQQVSEYYSGYNQAITDCEDAVKSVFE